jgi:DNA/RNA endonuclease G (NUC1)
MKRIYAVFLSIALLTVGSSFIFKTTARTEKLLSEQNFVSPNFVVSQFQVAGANPQDEFIELHNVSSSPADLNGYSLNYRSATGVNDVAMVSWTTSTIVPSGGYYLIANTSYTGSVPSNINYNIATVSMSATGGGIGLRNGAVNVGVVVDSVGYGTATNIFVEGTVTPAPALSTAQNRLAGGCQDTDINSADFANLIPSNPHNASSTPNPCGGGGGTTLLASGGATPSTVVPGNSTLLTVSVFPATTPPSTGIAVVGNLSNIGGSATQTFFDNGTNGDVTAGDNVFSYSYMVPTGTIGGTFGVSAVATDAQARSANVNFNVMISAPFGNENPLILGNPSNAATNVSLITNYLMIKPQYSLSYNRDKGEPNWVAWRLDSTWVGTAPRQDDYRGDIDLPAGWYQVQTTDYTGGGYDRGHMCPSGDRTRSIPDNSSTFLMTNFLPQLAANNQGPWEDFETYCRTLASGGNEIYIVSGGIGNMGTINNAGKVVIPQYTWKVAVVLPNGDNDLQRINKSTRVIATIVPNFIGTGLNINDVWRKYRTSVDAIENLTGYNFLSNVPMNTQSVIERRRDTQ